MPLLSLPKRLRPGSAPTAEAAAEVAAAPAEAVADPAGVSAGNLSKEGPGEPVQRFPRLAEFAALATLSRNTAGRLSPPLSVLTAVAWALTTVALGVSVVALLMHPGWGSANWSLATVWVGGWRISHLMPVSTSVGLVSLVPMLPALAVAGLLMRAAGWLWASLRSQGSGLATSGLAALGLTYFVVAAFIATSPPPQTQVEAPTTAGWGALFMLVLASVGWAWLRETGRASDHLGWLIARAVRTVVLTVGVLAALTLAAQFVLNFAEFSAVTSDLLSGGPQPSGVLDAVWLGVLQLAYLPNVLVWVAAYLTGVGFAVGESTVVSPFTVDYAGLPNLPLATLLPSSGLGWAILPPLAVASAAVLGGVVIRRAGFGWRLRSRITVGLALAVLTAIVAYFLAAASAGGLGEGRLSVLGPAPGAMAWSVATVTGLGYLAWAIFPSLVADLRPYAGQVGRRVKRVR